MRGLSRRSGVMIVLAALGVSAGRGAVARGEVVVSEKAPGNHVGGTFSLVADKGAAGLFVDANDYQVVRITADMLAGDVERVTGVKPLVQLSSDKVAAPAGRMVFLGTLGHAPAIDAIIREKKIDLSAIQGKWESYEMMVVEKPMPGVETGLLIVGSDRRGTAYGATELSEKIGVSPWEWWADVPAMHHENLYVSGADVHGPPSVKYRGIFLNDEDWGLQPWAAKTFEPETGDIGPKTYAKIFELLLRLKANFCWPAMHDVTKAFNIYPQNKQVADDYAIVMGSSHCEPMLRNNVTEWGQARAASYNYVTNRQGVLDYWKQRIVENGKFENVYTLGMRGIHDSDMAGGGTVPQRAQRLNQIMTDQRDLLRQLINPDLAQVPQIYCPYKEVLSLYQAGAVPADDVTLVWADDNFGYIRQLSTPAEQKRSGGAGVYYHISYWGRPHDYLWLCTTPPALVWEELSKAYDYGARNLWVINVGDLKPAEIDLTMAMGMGYDMGKYTLENQHAFVHDFAARTFGAAHADEIAKIMGEYYRLNYQRKPEHLGFNTSQNPGGPIQPTEFSDDEMAVRLGEFQELRQLADNLYKEVAPELRDAVYELVVYPVRCSALQNEKLLCADLNRRAAAEKKWDVALRMQERSQQAYDQIAGETKVFNEMIAGGKWKNIMSANPHNQDVFRLPKFATLPAGTVDPVQAVDKVRLIVNSEIVGRAGGFIESGGYVSMEAEHFTRAVDRGATRWQIIQGLGRAGDAVAVYPTTTASVTDVKNLANDAPALEYDFTVVTEKSDASIAVQAIPTHRINPERGLRYAVAVDDEVPQVVDLETAENSPTWSENVLRGAAIGTTRHKITAGKHTLRLYMVDPGVLLDQITIDLGGLKKSYLPPAETRAQ